jgi:hypothetical protein
MFRRLITAAAMLCIVSAPAFAGSDSKLLASFLPISSAEAQTAAPQAPLVISNPSPAATTTSTGTVTPTSTVTVPPSANPTTVVVPSTSATETPAWLNGVALFGIAITMALVGFGIVTFNKKMGLDQNASVIAIETQARDALHTALTSLAGRVLVELGPKVNQAIMNIQNPLIRQAAQDLPNMAGDALAMFGITSSDVMAQKIIDKIGVLTASNPTVFPTSNPAAAQAPAPVLAKPAVVPAAAPAA